ncbi:uncharacterized protein [Acropora muricata]
MFSWKTMILLTLLILALGSFCNPQVRAFMEKKIFKEEKEFISSLQKVTRLLADRLSNSPDEWKRDIGSLFNFFAEIPQEIWDLVDDMIAASTLQTSPIDEETERKQQRAKMRAAIYGKEEVPAMGNATKAEDVIKSLQFSSYEESNLCDLKEGIPRAEFDVTVEEIAELTNIPVTLKRVVKRARNFTVGNSLALDRLDLKPENGSMVFGRVAVVPIGDTYDMAYSLHSVNFVLKNRQSKPENARDFTKFSETLKGNDVDDDVKENSYEISFELRQDFLAFFHEQAIQGFVKHCDYLIKILDNGQE